MPQGPVFLERRNYKARRVIDAAHVLPLLGIFLWSEPFLWQSIEEPSILISSAGLYVFGVWLLLIISQFVLSWKLRHLPEDVQRSIDVSGSDKAEL